MFISDSLFYLGSGSIEMWPLTRAIQDSLQLPHTHDRSVSQVLYNSQMNQVVSICLEPVLKVTIRIWHTLSVLRKCFLEILLGLRLLVQCYYMRKPKLN